MRILVLLGVVFCVSLAVVVGSRMSVDATALVVGVACGVLASIPTSLILVWALSRREQVGTNRNGGVGGGYQYPPVVVVNPGQGTSRPAWSPPGLPGYDDLQLPGGSRQYRIVGDAETPGRVPEYRQPAYSNREW